MTHLHAAGFLLRPFTSADAPAFAAAVRESATNIRRWMGWAYEGYGEEDALAWFAACDEGRLEGSSHQFGIFRDDTFIGGAGLNHFNSLHAFCNLGYWVRASAQRQGAALSAVAAVSRYGFEVLKQSRIEIVVADGNAPSMAVARKSGAVHECLARNRLVLQGEPVAAHVFSLVPADLDTVLPTAA